MSKVSCILVAATLTGAASAAAQENPPVTVSVDVAANRHSISPQIYGVHFASTAQLQDLNATVNRLGGNSVGRYNWQKNIDNRGVDYFFMGFPYANTPGGYGDDFIAATKAGGAEPFLSMPMVGWVADTNGNRDVNWSFSVNKYGAFTGTNAVDGFPDAGNGCKVGAPLDNYHPCGGSQEGGTARPFTTNAPSDASVAAGVDFQQGWMQHVKDEFGSANAGGLKYWGLDNEPTLWHTAYWDVHPLGPTAAEMRTKMIDYGARIKTVDPGAQVLGPEEWGWDGYFFSGRDQQLWGQNQCNGAQDPVCPDRAAIGGEYVPWLLGQMKNYQDVNGMRILDMLTLHVYPQGGEVDNNGSDVSAAMQQKRNRSTRSLWDVNYVDESWIGTQVKLIPRMRDWVANAYPGTQLGLTEYDWGAENHINGATAEADLLGIFGREDLDMAIRWVVPATNSPVYNAFKMYRNYDGAKSTFGDTSVSATVPQPDELAAFAAQRGDGTLTVMVVNKVLANSTPTTVSLANFTGGGPAQVWQLTSANVLARLTDVAVVGNQISASLPAQSVTLFVVPASAPQISMGNAEVTEGNSGTVAASVPVTLSPASASTVTVAYATSDGTAVAGSDYVAATGTVTFAPGVTTAAIPITVNGDTVDEANEALLVTLSSPMNATLARAQGQLTVVDNDGRPALGRPILTLPFTITAQGNYWLVRNLSTAQTTGAAITIASDFVTVDLKGFKIGGGAAGFGTTAYGIHALNRRNITIRNGNIRGFYEAVFLEDSSGTFTSSQGHLVEALRADGNTHVGIHVHGRGSMLRNNQVVATGGTTALGASADIFGLWSEGPGARILNNDVTDTVGVGGGRGVAVGLGSGHGSVVERNRMGNAVLANSTGIFFASSQDVQALRNDLAVLSKGIDFLASTGRYRDNTTSGVTTPYTGGTDAGGNQ